MHVYIQIRTHTYTHLYAYTRSHTYPPPPLTPHYPPSLPTSPGEYSGAPTLQETYDYARTIFSLMCRHKDPKGKILIIGGGIANFTDVAATFTGIQKAMKQYRDELLEAKVGTRRAQRRVWCCLLLLV